MTSPRMLVQSEHYTEGVMLAADGRLYFSMTATGEILAMDGPESRATVWGYVPAANGHQIDRDGTHIVMASTGSIIRLDATGRIVGIVATTIAGRPLVYPNDVTIDAQRGGFYITDSGYTTMPKTVPAECSREGRVYRVDADGAPSEAASDLAYANGIALANDGSLLYVGESLTSIIWVYPVRGDGTLGARTEFARTPTVDGTRAVPDGITVDATGTVFVAHYGAGEVLMYAPSGMLTKRIPAGNHATSHVAVSADSRTLYISGGIESESGAGAIYAVDL